MKKILLTMLALGSTALVVAQSNPSPAANAVLVSQTREGNIVTSRYKIPHNNGKRAEFDIHYAINRSEITPAYSNNTRQITDLKDFMAHTQDSAMHISAIHIVGYASPDGNTTQNDSLASQRAQSLYHYAVNTYHPSHKIDTAHKTFQWIDCVSAVEESDIPQKEQVLSILKSTAHTEAQKEAALRKMSDAWKYLTTHILPEMRYADIEFDYGVDEFVTRTTTVEATEPAKPIQTSQPEVVTEEEVGIIIATPKHDNSKERKNRKERRDNKKSSKNEYEVIYWQNLQEK